MRRLYGDVKTGGGGSENRIDGRHLDKIFVQDSRSMEQLPDSSVHLMVTSPPYNVGKDYDGDLSMPEYVSMLRSVFTETYRVMVSGGRACVNIANVGRKPYIPYHKFIIDAMAASGFLMRGEVIWHKGAGAGASTAWGSWMSASNPTLRDTHEYVLIFSKNMFGREKHDRRDTITKDEFLEFTKSVWHFGPERARRVGHPAPFPVELPYRCIQLFTFEGEIVFDPFGGSGTTAVAAVRSGRRFVLAEKNAEYAEAARRRVARVLAQRRLD